MQKQFKLTHESLEKLKDELEYLKTVREKEVADQIKEARSFGDLSENSEYDEAKNEQGKLYSRIAEIENVIYHAVLINENDIKTNEVSPGSKIRVIDLEDDTEEAYHVVGSQESDPKLGRISDDSPFGKALIGHKVGDEIEVPAPAGTFRYKIIEISR